MRASLCLVLPAALGILGLASPAFAGCDIEGDMFYMHANDKSHHAVKTDSYGCDLHFITAGNIKFHDVSIVENPKNGELQQIAILEFRYVPKPGFKGTDTFALKVCGSTPKGSGCSLLTYTSNVE